MGTYFCRPFLYNWLLLDIVVLGMGEHANNILRSSSCMESGILTQVTQCEVRSSVNRIILSTATLPASMAVSSGDMFCGLYTVEPLIDDNLCVDSSVTIVTNICVFFRQLLLNDSASFLPHFSATDKYMPVRSPP